MSERERDCVWDTLEELFGAVRTKSERGRRNHAVKELREAGATPDEIRVTYRYCQRTFSMFGEMAICAHLSAATRRGTVLSMSEMRARLQEGGV